MDETDVIDTMDAPLPDEPQAPEEESKQDVEDAAKGEAEPEGEEEEDGDADDGETDEEPEKPKRRRPGKYQRQIMRMQAQNEALEATVRTLLQQVNGKAEPVQSQPSTAEPREEEFQDRDDYLVAKAEWKIQQRLEAERRRQVEEQQRARTAETARTFQERAAEARAKYDDFDDVAFNPDIPVTAEMTAVIGESELGPDIAYFLGSHPQEARRIASLSPLAQAVELGRIEVKLSAPAPKRTTKAPEPPKVLGKASSVEKDPSKMSYEEYKAFRAGKG